MFNKCRLVHADLSEYNILYHDGSIVVIDVSQAVDRDHCNAMEFLRNDCSNITGMTKKYFGISYLKLKKEMYLMYIFFQHFSKSTMWELCHFKHCLTL